MKTHIMYKFFRGVNKMYEGQEELPTSKNSAAKICVGATIKITFQSLPELVLSI